MMKMSQVWPKSKAIALVFCSKMTQIEIDGVYLQTEKVMENEPIVAKK